MSATAQHTDAPPATVAEQLRVIADWLDQHPDATVATVDLIGTTIRVFDYTPNTAEQMATKAVRIGGRWDKHVDDLYYLRQPIAPGITFELAAMRDRVCTRAVTGSTVETVIGPDPALVAQLPAVERQVTVDTFEWRCEPLLANSQAA